MITEAFEVNVDMVDRILCKNNVPKSMGPDSIHLRVLNEYHRISRTVIKEPLATVLVPKLWKQLKYGLFLRRGENWTF